MWKFWISFCIAYLGLCLVATAAIWSFPPFGGTSAFFEGYAKNCRTPIFSACVTLGSFMLTLKSAILSRLKEGFDSERFVTSYLNSLPSDDDLSEERSDRPHYYQTLRNFAAALTGTIILSLTTAVIQMTAGFIQQAWTLGLSVGSAVTTLGLVLFLTKEMFMCQREWFGKIEEDRMITVRKSLKTKAEELEKWDKENPTSTPNPKVKRPRP
jgi:hypothetical protein